MWQDWLKLLVCFLVSEVVFWCVKRVIKRVFSRDVKKQRVFDKILVCRIGEDPYNSEAPYYGLVAFRGANRTLLETANYKDITSAAKDVGSLMRNACPGVLVTPSMLECPDSINYGFWRDKLLDLINEEIKLHTD